MKHKQELINILMADAKIQCRYSDKEGNTCAIGGIAVAFGWDPKAISAESNGRHVALLLGGKAKIVAPLKKAMKHFALTPLQFRALQRINDREYFLERRHNRLKEEVESWEEDV